MLGEMRLISFDIGIKNMAYCIFETDASSNIVISSWNVLNLLQNENENAVEKPTCNQPKVKEKLSKSKAKTTNTTNTNTKDTSIKTVCGSLAKFHKDGQCYCMKHAKTSGFIMPTKNTTEAGIKKKKIDELQKIAASHFLSLPEGCLKRDMIDIVTSFYEKNALKPVLEVKSKSAGEVDLISIGRNMKRLLDEIPHLEGITNVIIENQISPIANRMKTLQGMLTQYFIMRGRPDIQIEFISSANKLKGFLQTKEQANEKKGEYKKHKNDGIAICRQFLDANPEWSIWKTRFEVFPAKKDDLADSFLQGIWYLKTRKLIIYAENLKINSVFLT